MKTTLVLVMLGFAALLILGVLASIRHPTTADQIQIDFREQRIDPPIS